MAQQQYVLSPDSTLRQFPVLLVAAAAGFVLFGLGLGFDRSVLIILGAVCIAIGTALLVLRLIMQRRVTTTVDLDDDGVRVTSGGRSAAARWTEIRDVSLAGQTIYLARDTLPALKIDSPRGSGDPRLAELSQELVGRLDRSRGYRDL